MRRLLVRRQLKALQQELTAPPPGREHEGHRCLQGCRIPRSSHMPPIPNCIISPCSGSGELRFSTPHAIPEPVRLALDERFYVKLFPDHLGEDLEYEPNKRCRRKRMSRPRPTVRRGGGKCRVWDHRSGLRRTPGWRRRAKGVLGARLRHGVVPVRLVGRRPVTQSGLHGEELIDGLGPLHVPNLADHRPASTVHQGCRCRPQMASPRATRSARQAASDGRLCPTPRGRRRSPLATDRLPGIDQLRS